MKKPTHHGFVSYGIFGALLLSFVLFQTASSDMKKVNPISDVVTTQTSSHTIVSKDKQFEDIPDELLSSIENEIVTNKDIVFPTDNYDIKSVRKKGENLFLSLGYLDVPVDILQALNRGEITSWGTPLQTVLAKQDKKGVWKVALRNTSKFDGMIDEISDQDMPTKEKKAFKKTTTDKRSVLSEFLFPSVYADDKNYKFPWPSGVKFTLTQTWHSCYATQSNCALDFAISTSNDDDRRVLASEAGTITDICTKGTQTANVTIDHNGQTFDYFHIDKSKLNADIKTNMTVQQGQILGGLKVGDVYEWAQQKINGVLQWDSNHQPIMEKVWDGCGIAFQQGAHVHFQLRPSEVINMDGWVLNKTKDYLYPVGISDDPTKTDKEVGRAGLNSKFTSSNSPVSSNMCDSIVPDMILSGQTFAQGVTCKANSTITTGPQLVVTSSGNITLIAGVKVALSPGTTFQLGSRALVMIGQ